MQRSEEHSGPSKVALGLCNIRLNRDGIRVIRHIIENLIKLSQCFGETTKIGIQKGMLSEQANVARVEALGLIEVGLAPIPLASPPCDISQRFRNPAVIRQELACLLKVTHRAVVIL